jgi:lipoate-protein ligase A
VSWDEAAGALAAGFAEALNLVLAPDALTAEELAEAQALRTEKYATAQWTDLL